VLDVIFGTPDFQSRTHDSARKARPPRHPHNVWVFWFINCIAFFGGLGYARATMLSEESLKEFRKIIRRGKKYPKLTPEEEYEAAEGIVRFFELLVELDRKGREHRAGK